MPRLTFNQLVVGFFAMGVAAFLVLWWGRTGISWFDYSSFVDISYRLLNGQKMYVDIGGCPHPPLTYFLQALFFKIFGVQLFACLIHAAVINAIVAGVIYFYFQKILPSPWPLLLALLSGLYYYGISSFPWPERLGYFFILIAFILWDRLATNPLKSSPLLFLIGFFTALPLWDKQGLSMISTLGGVVLLLLHFGRSKKLSDLFWFGVGYFIAVASLLGYLWFNGWEESIFEYWVRGHGYGRFYWILRIDSYLVFWNFVVTLGLVLIGWHWWFEGKIVPLKWRLICLTVLALIQLINSPLSGASAIVDSPLIALVCGWAFSLQERGQNQPGGFLSLLKKNFVCTGALCFLIFIGVFFGSIPTLWKLPTAHFPDAIFEPMHHSFFKGFKVDQPNGKEWDHALDWLSSHLGQTETFWVFPSGGLFYVALQRVSNSPLVLWDFLNMAVPEVRQRDEAKGLHWLMEAQPTWVIMLKQGLYPDIAYHDPSFVLSVLPNIANFFKTSYSKVYETKMFGFYRRKDGK